jgi:hypothetical protein
MNGAQHAPECDTRTKPPADREEIAKNTRKLTNARRCGNGGLFNCAEARFIMRGAQPGIDFEHIVVEHIVVDHIGIERQ